MAKSKSATPDQKTASNPAASAWVGANAGSGKTHVLVDRVTRLMLAGVDPMSILCLTYTKAAAKEMANRLHERLGAWVRLSNAELSERLASMGQDEASHQMVTRARRLFTGHGNAWRPQDSNDPCLLRENSAALSGRGGACTGIRSSGISTKPSKSCGVLAIMCCVKRNWTRATDFAKAFSKIASRVTI